MEIYLVRHTETVAENGVCYGNTNVALKKPYLDKFQRIAGQINIKNPLIYSSPLIRCAKLANYLNHKFQQKVFFDVRLKEMNFGQWEMKKWDEIDKDHLQLWMKDFVNQGVPGGESFVQLNNRVNQFIDNELLKIKSQRPAIIVTHAGVLRCFLCRSRNIALKDSFNITVDYGSVFKISLD